jgi:hypothetical protein
MRPSRVSTTVDIYAQFVPEGGAAPKLSECVEQESKRVPLLF